jgi:DNA-binding transcriptional LysR family regulator
MRALECLVAVVEQGSLTGAAAVLHLSQPALSHQIGMVERELGTPVIERLSRGVRPTAAGMAAATEAKAALAAADRAVTAGRSAAAGAWGRIRVACCETMTAWALAPMLHGWRRQFPGVEIDLSEYTSADRMLETMLADGADITVGPRPSRASQHTEVLGRVEVMVVAAPQYRFSAAQAVPLAELAAGPLVHYHPGNEFGAWLDRLAARHGVTLPQPVLRTDSTRTAAQLAATGMGITLAPCSALTPLPEATVRSLDPPEFIDIVITIAAPHDHLIRRFAAALKQHGLPDSSLAAGEGDDCARRAPGRRTRRARMMTAEG